jgi:hypothetical protein
MLIYYNYYIYMKMTNQKNFSGISRIIPIFTRDGLFTGHVPVFARENPCAFPFFFRESGYL